MTKSAPDPTGPTISYCDHCYRPVPAVQLWRPKPSLRLCDDCVIDWEDEQWANQGL